LGVLIDQHTSVAGVYVPFFGRPAFTPTAVAKISLMTGVPVVPMAMFLEPSGKHRVHVLPAIEPEEKPGERESAVIELTRRYSLALEQLIRIDPKQWVWFHHRWREPESSAVAGAVYAAHQ